MFNLNIKSEVFGVPSACPIQLCEIKTIPIEIEFAHHLPDYFLHLLVLLSLDILLNCFHNLFLSYQSIIVSIESDKSILYFPLKICLACTHCSQKAPHHSPHP